MEEFKCQGQLMLDYTFIKNHRPENTPLGFRKNHTKGFLQLLHPNISLAKNDWKFMQTKSLSLGSCCFLSKLQFPMIASMKAIIVQNINTVRIVTIIFSVQGYY